MCEADHTVRAAATVNVREQLASISAEQLAALAEQIYEISTQEDPAPFVEQLFNWLEIPTLNLDDGERIKASFKAGLLFVLDIQLQSIAQCLQMRRLIKLDSVLAWLNSEGITTRDTQSPLTADYLAERFSQIGKGGTFTEKEVIPGLILALTRERTKRSNLQEKETIWGDRGLDSIQTTLLLYGFIQFPPSESLLVNQR
jgi:hypothetical protein